MSGEEHPDLTSAMNRTAIPEQIDQTAQMAQEITEEGLEGSSYYAVSAFPNRRLTGKIDPWLRVSPSSAHRRALRGRRAPQTSIQPETT